ncbi:hypothetical protein HYU92_04295 [Candidatus Curtissbacteria bacterium]|nr:hypothetical protein [Candidatus Curtissbacteria bacterium]
MERLSVPKEILPVLAVFGIYACSSPVPIIEIPTAAPTRTPEPTATFVPTRTPMPTSTPIRIEPTSTRSPIRVEATPNISGMSDLDKRNKELLENAMNGQIVNLEGTLVSRIYRIPFLGEGDAGKEAYVAELSVENNRQVEVVSQTLSADCIYTSMMQNRQLGESSGLPFGRLRVWDQKQRLDGIDILVGFFNNATKVSNLGQTLTCEVQKIRDEVAAILSNVSWKQAPRETGRAIVWLIGELFSGGQEQARKYFPELFR